MRENVGIERSEISEENGGLSNLLGEIEETWIFADGTDASDLQAGFQEGRIPR
jgi:hypothetical protein